MSTRKQDRDQLDAAVLETVRASGSSVKTSDLERAHGAAAGRAAARLEKAGKLAKTIEREFDKCDNAAQSWRFGGATRCVRRRAYWSAV